MSRSTTHPHLSPAPAGQPVPPHDLVDFHLRWPEFRFIAARLAERDGIAPIDREVISWLLRLADRVGPRDLV